MIFLMIFLIGFFMKLLIFSMEIFFIKNMIDFLYDFLNDS